MMTRPTDPIELYAWLKQEISKLDAEMDSLKEEVFQAVQAGGEEVEKDGFTIRSYKRPKYKFSDTYKQKNDELKALKAEEIEKEVATIDGYTEYVTVRFKKDKGKDKDPS